MSRVCKKIIGLFGLATVIGITAVASGIPPVQNDASAASGNVNIEFRVYDANFEAQILSPADGSTYFSDDGVTARINYSNASTLNVYMTYPDGTRILVDGLSLGDASGTVDVTLPVTPGEYGNYILEVEGTDLGGSTVSGGTVTFAYRALTIESIEEDTIGVNYGSTVCRVGFQVYRVTDTNRENPLLDPEYIVDAPQQGGALPNFLETQIPGFAELGPDEFEVVATAYDCSDNAIDSDSTTAEGILAPPTTGAISIFGVTISRIDYIITGLAAFVLITIFALFLLRRQKKSKR